MRSEQRVLRRGNAVPIGDILARAIRSRQWEGPLQREAAVVAWSRVVGAALSAQTMPIAVRGNVLLVAVRHQAWATQLTFLRTDILRRLRSECGADVRDIVFDSNYSGPWEGRSFGAVAPARPDGAQPGVSGSKLVPIQPSPLDIEASFALWQAASRRRSRRVDPLGTRVPRP